MTTIRAILAILLGFASCATLAADMPPPAEFHQIFRKLLAAEGQDYLSLRSRMIALGLGTHPELRRISESKTSDWQERALARALLARTAAISTTHSLDNLHAMLKTATLPRWAIPKKPHGAENEYEPLGSPAYIEVIGWAAFCLPEWADVTTELLWKGLITNPDSLRSLLARLRSENGHADHQLVVGIARVAFNRTKAPEIQQLAVRAMLAHIGPARQDGWPVQDPAGVIKWLVSVATDSQNDPDLRATIIEHLGGTGEPAAIEPVLRFLRQPDPPLQSAAVRSCGALLTYLAPDSPQRGQIVDALGKVLDTPGIEDSLVQDTFFVLASTNAVLYPEAAKQAAAVLETHLSQAREPVSRSYVEQQIRYFRNQSTRPAAKPESQPSYPRVIGRPTRTSATTQPVVTRLQVTAAESQPSTQPQ